MNTPRQEALRARVAEVVQGVPTAGELAALCPTLAAETAAVPQSFFLDGRGLYAVFGAMRGEEILQAFERAAAAETSLGAVLRRALSWMEPQARGVDLGSAATRDMVAMLTPGILTAAEAAVLLGLGELVAPTWPGLTVSELEEAYRPEREAVYAAEQALLAARAAVILAEYEATLAEDEALWALYQASTAARNRAQRHALDAAEVELRAEGLIRG